MLYSYAMSGCDSLGVLRFYGQAVSLERIEKYALAGTSIISLELPATVRYLGSYALPLKSLEVLVIKNTGDWRYQRNAEASALKVSDSFYSDPLAYMKQSKYEGYIFFRPDP